MKIVTLIFRFIFGHSDDFAQELRISHGYFSDEYMKQREKEHAQEGGD